jgi:thioredoxin
MSHISSASGAEAQEAIRGDQLTLIKFSADWCGPCKALAPIVHAVAGKRTDVKFLEVDVDKEQKLAMTLGIRGVPTLMAFRNGGLVWSQVGVLTQQALEAQLQKLQPLAA